MAGRYDRKQTRYDPARAGAHACACLIGIAVLGGAHPLGVVLSALLFGALKVGGLLVTQTSSVPSSIIAILEGFVMLYVILSFYLRHRLRRACARRRAAAGGEAP